MTSTLFSLHGKAAIVAGGMGKFGWEASVALNKAGAKLYILGRSKAVNTQQKDILEDLNMTYLSCDCSDPDSVSAAIGHCSDAPSIFDLIHGGVAIDTLAMAREKRPGKRNSLDALCRDYKVDASERTLHGALLDAELLTQVYLAMTREQSRMFAGSDNQQKGSRFESVKKLSGLDRQPLVCMPTSSELENHEAFLTKIRETSDSLLWDQTE